VTPKEADRLISKGKPVKLCHEYGEVFTVILVRRDGASVYTADGQALNRRQLEVKA
jgi:hypothetical protein